MRSVTRTRIIDGVEGNRMYKRPQTEILVMGVVSGPDAWVRTKMPLDPFSHDLEA